MTRRFSNTLAMATAVLALAYLSLMVLVGELPGQSQLVRFEARGIMQVPPEQIDRVELVQGEQKVLLHRDREAARWIGVDGSAVSMEAGRHLAMAVQMMNTSAPVKELPEEELIGVDHGPFGLDAPAVQAGLYRGQAIVMQARFGGINPEGYLQYMAVAGDPRVFLMSRFVGAEWRMAADAVFGR
ncbi:MAG: hypothetical protein IT532_06570 [Burkholderiales bacterium]|nr:hypothetical protein [Burkholderiales bacterium]